MYVREKNRIMKAMKLNATIYLDPSHRFCRSELHLPPLCFKFIHLHFFHVCCSQRLGDVGIDQCSLSPRHLHLSLYFAAQICESFRKPATERSHRLDQPLLTHNPILSAFWEGGIRPSSYYRRTTHHTTDPTAGCLHASINELAVSCVSFLATST